MLRSDICVVFDIRDAFFIFVYSCMLYTGILTTLLTLLNNALYWYTYYLTYFT
jgi:hypothetical protein